LPGDRDHRCDAYVSVKFRFVVISVQAQSNGTYSFLRIEKLRNFPEEDLSSSSPGLLYSATLGKRQPASQSRRGCVRLRIETVMAFEVWPAANPLVLGLSLPAFPR